MNLKRGLWAGLFFLSIFFNLVTVISSINLPSYKLGVLQRDLVIADYSNDRKVLFKIPKGLTVMDASPRGLGEVGLFLPKRFTFVIAGSNEFIDYSPSIAKSPDGSLYQVASKEDQVQN